MINGQPIIQRDEVDEFRALQDVRDMQ